MTDELYHYGVKGMRWGIRRHRDSDSGSSRKKTRVKDMSDVELRNRINRLNMEKQYRDLNQSSFSKAGRRIVQGILVASAMETSKNFVSKYAKQGLEYLVGSAQDKVIDIAGNVVGRAVEKAFQR